MNMYLQPSLSAKLQGERVSSGPSAIFSLLALSALEFSLQPAGCGSAIVAQLRSLKAELQRHYESVDKAQRCLLMAAVALILLMLSSCSTEMKVSNAAPYDDINEVPDRRFVRAYFKHLVANHWERVGNDEVLICGDVEKPGCLRLGDGLTIEGALKKAKWHSIKTPIFDIVAVWRAREGVFYGVNFPEERRPRPSARTLLPSTPLEPGDAVIALVKLCAF